MKLNSIDFLGNKTSWIQLQNQLKSAHFCGRKIKWIQLGLLPRKSTEFSSFSWQKNDLNWARFIAQKINWVELVILPRKSTKFSSFYCLENFLCKKRAEFNWFSSNQNEQNSVNFPATKMSWNKLIFKPSKRAEYSWFSCHEMSLN